MQGNHYWFPCIIHLILEFTLLLEIHLVLEILSSNLLHKNLLTAEFIYIFIKKS